MSSYIQKNAQALSLTLLFTGAAAQSAEPPSPDLNTYYTATSAQENFVASGAKNGVNYGASTGVISVTLPDGSSTTTGAGGAAQNDTFNSSVQNIIGANSPGNAGYNIITGNAENNILIGTGSSKNNLEGKGGADTLIGSPNGWNWTKYTSSPAGVTIDLEKGTGVGGDAQGDKFYNINAVDGSKFGDSLTGSGRNETLRGGAGFNFLNPKDGDDTSIGGPDSDMHIYSSGNDTIQESTTGSAGHTDTVVFASVYSPVQTVISENKMTFDPSNSITFSDINLIEKFSFSGYASMTLDQVKNARTTAPNPTFEISQSATSAAENFSGVNGNTVDYSFSPAPVTVSLETGATGSGGTALGDRYGADILNLVGADTPASAGYNKLVGDENNNRLYGVGSSKNILDGRGGADTLVGSPQGWNWVEYGSSPATVTINQSTNVNTGGHAQGDLLYNIQAVKGSTFNDNFTGNSANNTFDGIAGIDTVHFTGQFSDYTITGTAGKLTVKDNRATPSDGTETLTNVEKLIFTNGTFDKIAGSNTGTNADWRFNSSAPVGTISIISTMQAENVAGMSDMSDPFTLERKVSAGEGSFKILFDAPDFLVNESCVATVPVTNYYVHISAYDRNNSLYQTDTQQFSVTDPALKCEDDYNKYVEKCGVYTQKCEIDEKVNILSEPGM